MSYSLKPISEQVIVVTGASSGIGLVTARAAAMRGARVMLVARNEAVLKEVTESLKAAGFAAEYSVADMGIADEVEAAAGRTAARWGGIDTWVNNAGGAIYARLEDTPADEHERLFQTNYFGVVNGSLAALKHLKQSGGALITVGSIVGDIPAPMMGAYAASKHAVKGFVETLRMELLAEGAPVSVTLIKPSGIDTPIAQNAAGHVDGEPRIPPPLYDPKLVARAILFAAEHKRRSITVGGAGRAQVLLGTHFPQLLEWMTPLLLPGVVAPDGAGRDGPGDLYGSRSTGAERSDKQSGFAFSPYTEAQLRPVATAAVVGVAALGIGALMMRRRGGWRGNGRGGGPERRGGSPERIETREAS